MPGKLAVRRDVMGRRAAAPGDVFKELALMKKNSRMVRDVVAMALPLLAGVAGAAYAEGPKPLDAALSYTVQVVSPIYGNSAETRSIASGESDDYTWKTVPPKGAVPVDPRCPGADTLPLDANHAMHRQTQVRVAPSVNAKGVARVQLSFQGHAPGPMRTVRVGGASLQCPVDIDHHQILRFTMTLDGEPKTLHLQDGTTITVTGRR